MDEDFILISGLQHLLFCPRQWALIHMEGVWGENSLTASGRVLHEKAHSGADESRPGLIVTRSLPLRCERLNIDGVADVVEFHHADDGVELPRRRGRWRPFPVEYKNGRPKKNDCDRVQLCAQAVCLEEMLGCAVPSGALFYGAARRREDVEFSLALRAKLEESVARAREMMKRGVIPPPVRDKRCRSCSLAGVCQPDAGRSVREYLRRHIEENANETDA